MFLPHFFVSSCPVDTFLIDYTGTRYGNQYQYICVYIIDIRWAGTIRNSILCQFVSPCPAMSHDVSRCLTIIPVVSACLIYIAFSMCRPQARFRPAPRPAFRHAKRGAAYLFACPSRRSRCQLSFLELPPNSVCGLCRLLQVVYIDWNIGYYVNCQEGNDGHAVR